MTIVCIILHNYCCIKKKYSKTLMNFIIIKFSLSRSLYCQKLTLTYKL